MYLAQYHVSHMHLQMGETVETFGAGNSLSVAFQKYTQLLKSCNAVDFNDLLIIMARLLTSEGCGGPQL